MKTDTVTSEVTLQDVEITEAEYLHQSETDRALDRLIGTYETYGAWTSGKPNFSKGVLCKI